MTLTTRPPVPPSEPNRRLFTREEFERLAEIGLFGPLERVELVEGEIIEKMTQNSPHATGISAVGEELRRVFHDGAYVRIQMPIALGPMSQPDPDVAVVTGSFRDYETAHPTTALLVVEVSDTTLGFDRTVKAAMYARASIPEYWILNLNERVLEVYRNAEATDGTLDDFRYSTVVRYGETESVSPLARPDHNVLVSNILPRRI